MTSPSLRTWKHRKTMSIDWYSDRYEFALDHEELHIALCAIWERCRAQCRRGASFSYGDSGGHMAFVPVEVGMEAVTTIRQFYNKGLTEMSV